MVGKSEGLRLVIRREGEMWNAYLVKLPDTRDEFLLGSLRMSVVQRNKVHKKMFMDLMKAAVSDAVQERLGVPPTFDAECVIGRERAGHA